ncbi:MAG TPA: YkvA family protein [Terriglobales bacterium]|jgi:uncharacterized membrane protein YkvA (DUF1232 family)
MKATRTNPNYSLNKNWLQKQSEKWRHDVKLVVRQTRVLMFALKHPKVPWYAKLVAGSSIAYIFSPIQLIPTFIPIIGQMDDLLVLFIGTKLLRKLTPATILDECITRAERAPLFQLKKPRQVFRDEHKQESSAA